MENLVQAHPLCPFKYMVYGYYLQGPTHSIWSFGSFSVYVLMTLLFAIDPTLGIFVLRCNRFEFYISSTTLLLYSKNRMLRRSVEPALGS